MILIELEEAKALAEATIADGQRLTAASEGTKHWFFDVGDSLVDAIPDYSPIVINKVSGNVSFPMPSIPSKYIGEQPTAIELECEKASKVPLP